MKYKCAFLCAVLIGQSYPFLFRHSVVNIGRKPSNINTQYVPTAHSYYCDGSVASSAVVAFASIFLTSSHIGLGTIGFQRAIVQ